MAELYRLIDEIRELNPSAPSEWLMEFDATALREYLERLRAVQEPAAPVCFTRRPDEEPIHYRECA
ncbi:MAG: hypothetical protein GC172_05810 [Phycisphaera sp.]|nr:hypothetical protein [Phycisphaera sp.]